MVRLFFGPRQEILVDFIEHGLGRSRILVGVCYSHATLSKNESFRDVENTAKFLREKVAATKSTFLDFAMVFSELVEMAGSV
jgi:hypothetical protein